MSAARLATRMVAKPWGRDSLPAPFAAPAGERIGEIWFEVPDALDGLLAKYLFTSEKLSVQVHPDDARAPEGSRGKEECWLILDAEPGAALALGFREDYDADNIRRAAEDGSIEDMLHWQPVSPGDFFYLPAGTVHAIGAGLALVEIQQESDITYRLFDYGRPRELHVAEALEVGDFGPYPWDCHRKVEAGATTMLVDGPHFRLAQVAGDDISAIADRFPGAVQILPLAGEVRCVGLTIGSGESGCCESLAEAEFAAEGRCLVAMPLQPRAA